MMMKPYPTDHWASCPISIHLDINVYSSLCPGVSWTVGRRWNSSFVVLFRLLKTFLGFLGVCYVYCVCRESGEALQALVSLYHDPSVCLVFVFSFSFPFAVVSNVQRLWCFGSWNSSMLVLSAVVLSLCMFVVAICMIQSHCIPLSGSS